MEGLEQKEFKIKIDNYSGPLDALLDLAKMQKVDLTTISVTQLADQFIEFINKAQKLNLDLAAEYLLMASWLAYLKSKLLLPQLDEDNFEATEVAKKLKLQLKKLELIRLLSDQLLKKNRLGIDIRTRGTPGGVRLVSTSKYSVTLYDLLKSYSNHVMKKNFLSINIPKLPVCTTEQAIQVIKKNINKLTDWKNFIELIPSNFKKSLNLKKTGIAGFFAASLELTKDGMISIMQEKEFEKIFIKEKK
jgi:segregation and condensation protein A